MSVLVATVTHDPLIAVSLVFNYGPLRRTTLEGVGKLDVSEAITWLVLLGAALSAVWGSLVLIARGSFTGKRYDLSRSEKWLAMTPVKIVGWFTRLIPVDDGFDGGNWKSLSERHVERLRTASKANDVLFVVPWTVALLVATTGICQLTLTLIPALTPNTRLSDLLLSFGITLLFFLPMMATHEVRHSRWRARAPFEWQFISASLWLLDASGVSDHGARNPATKLNSYLLWRVEATMIDRFGRPRRSTAPSRRLAHESWLGLLSPLFRDAALLQLGSHGRVDRYSVRAWVETAAGIIVLAGSSKPKRSFFRRNELPVPARRIDPIAPFRRPSDARFVILMVLLASASSFVLWWISENLFNPQSLRDLITLIRANPAAAVGILVSTLAMLATVGQALVSYASLQRPGRHI